MSERLPFWSVDFDTDLLRVFPDLEARLGPVANVRLFTHGNPTHGRLNHPNVWNGIAGMVAFFGFNDPAKPSEYYTNAPVIECTFLEALRDGWVHDFTMLVEGQVVFDGSSLCQDFMPIMGHIRRWKVLSDDELEAKKARVFRIIELATQVLRRIHERIAEANAAPMLAAFMAIDKTKLDRGDVPCPKCGGKLVFAHAGPKRHVRAACETDGCIRFMS